MSSQELQFSSQRNCEKVVFEGYLIAFDKFSADYTKKFWRCDRRHDGFKVRIHTNASTNLDIHYVQLFLR